MPIVRDVMQRDVLTIPAAMPFAEILRVMVVAAVHGAPVIDENGKVVGMLSAMDLLRATEQAYDDERDEGEGADPLAQLRQATARQLASPEPAWVRPDASLADVARLYRVRPRGLVALNVRVDLRGTRPTLACPP